MKRRTEKKRATRFLDDWAKERRRQRNWHRCHEFNMHLTELARAAYALLAKSASAPISVTPG